MVLFGTVLGPCDDDVDDDAVGRSGPPVRFGTDSGAIVTSLVLSFDDTTSVGGLLLIGSVLAITFSDDAAVCVLPETTVAGGCGGNVEVLVVAVVPS